jgi:hypothetical protein
LMSLVPAADHGIQQGIPTAAAAGYNVYAGWVAASQPCIHSIHPYMMIPIEYFACIALRALDRKPPSSVHQHQHRDVVVHAGPGARPALCPPDRWIAATLLG